MRIEPYFVFAIPFGGLPGRSFVRRLNEALKLKHREIPRLRSG